MSSYKHGSFNLSHENAGMNVLSTQWLGVRSRDVLAGNGQDDYNGLLRLSARDRKKGADMLERKEVLQEGGKEEQWRHELQVMLMLNVKAEMEVLSEREGGVKGWVEEKLLEKGTGMHPDEEYSPSLQASEDTVLDETPENGTSWHTDENLHETDQPADMTLDKNDSPSLQANEEILLDEAPEMSTHEEGPLSLQTEEDLLEINLLADMTLDEDDSPNPSEDTMLDEPPEMSAHGQSPTTLHEDDDSLNTHQMEDMSLADQRSPISEIQVDENLLDTHELADMSLAEGDQPEILTSEESIPCFEWDEEL